MAVGIDQISPVELRQDGINLGNLEVRLEIVGIDQISTVGLRLRHARNMAEDEHEVVGIDQISTVGLRRPSVVVPHPVIADGLVGSA